MTERVLFALQDLVAQLQVRNAKPKSFDAYSAKSDPRVSSSTAKSMEINEENCLRIVSQLQEVSHMVWQCLPPHSVLWLPRGQISCFLRLTDSGSDTQEPALVAGSHGVL